jgi:hypothetical protein
MTVYAHSQSTTLSSDEAWAGLLEMENWLPTLTTVTAVKRLPGDGLPPARDSRFLLEGRRYLVETPEKITMNCSVVEVDSEKRRVRIAAKSGPIRSRLTCEVREDADGKAILFRRQEYPGVVGWLLTRLAGKREDEETRAYLQAWEDSSRTA